ncbi:hypothetical protein CEXT_181281 [Caerostris extrusa]|uniref:Uncharacterized protein n=1 Tax=Caerostris extrusa TaxID=172846 RepID=A0AAV4TNS8_CAEEX|nr:hypothetical protein CEXT_181281 [Caerostris extrusa]
MVPTPSVVPPVTIAPASVNFPAREEPFESVPEVAPVPFFLWHPYCERFPTEKESFECLTLAESAKVCSNFKGNHAVFCRECPRFSKRKLLKELTLSKTSDGPESKNQQ